MQTWLLQFNVVILIYPQETKTENLNFRFVKRTGAPEHTTSFDPPLTFEKTIEGFVSGHKVIAANTETTVLPVSSYSMEEVLENFLACELYRYY